SGRSLRTAWGPSPVAQPLAISAAAPTADTVRSDLAEARPDSPRVRIKLQGRLHFASRSPLVATDIVAPRSRQVLRRAQADWPAIARRECRDVDTYVFERHPAAADARLKSPRAGRNYVTRLGIWSHGANEELRARSCQWTSSNHASKQYGTRASLWTCRTWRSWIARRWSPCRRAERGELHPSTARLRPASGSQARDRHAMSGHRGTHLPDEGSRQRDALQRPSDRG